jgi:transposase
MNAEHRKRLAFRRAGQLVASYLSGVPLPVQASVAKSTRKQFGRPNPDALLHLFGTLYEAKGDLEFDPDAAERALRAVAIGRRNYLFFGSDVGGETAAALYTFTQTCQVLNIEPWPYLRDVLERLPSHPPDRLAELLPQAWAQAKRAAAAAEPPDDVAAPGPG